MNWGQIKAAVRELAHRSDISDALFAIFLPVAEQRMYWGESNAPAVRLSAMRKTVTLTNGAPPPDFLAAIKVGDGLSYRPLGALSQHSGSYTWNGQALVLSRGEAFPVELTYVAKFPALAVDADTNWLTDNAPNVYITSLLVEVGRWASDDAMGTREAANYISTVNALISSDKAASISGSPLTIRGMK